MISSVSLRIPSRDEFANIHGFKMTLRQDEQFARDGFDQHVRQVERSKNAIWESHPNGQSLPPDCCLQIGEKRFAVEITAIHTQYSQDDGGNVSELSVWKYAENLVDKIEREAKKNGTLKGAYAVTFYGPYRNLGASAKEIRRLVLDHLEKTQGDCPGLELEPPLNLESGGQISITKIGVALDAIGHSMFGDGGDWGWAIVEEYAQRIIESIDIKASKLREVPKPWILLLLDEIGYANEGDLQQLKDRLATEFSATGSNASHFNAICLVNRDQTVFELKSSDVD